MPIRTLRYSRIHIQLVTPEPEDPKNPTRLTKIVIINVTVIAHLLSLVKTVMKMISYLLMTRTPYT
jgi:hypothetical protein